jgi:glycosyltransferase involved in cell wall biosynthesis
VKVLAVVVPAKDEEATLGELLDRVARVTVPGHVLRPIVVDDGSADRTSEVARERGASVVAYLDADLEYYPEDIPGLVEPILAGRADYALGSRFLGGARGMRLYRRLGNYAFTALLALLTGCGISDGQSGMRAFSREAAARAEIIHDYNYAQVLTLDLVRKGFRLEEVPIRYRVREHGESFVTWRYPAKVLPAIWRELRSP